MRIGENSVAPVAALAQRARTSPDGVAFIAGCDQWKYAWVAAQAERIARGLIGRGIRKGDRIALHMRNRPEFVVSVYACFHIGAVALPLDHKLKAVELKSILERSWPALYIGDANLCGLVDEIDGSILPPETRFVVGDIGKHKGVQPWESLFKDGAGPLPVTADIHSPAVLFPAAVMPGVTRFVMHTQATLAALFGLPFMCGS
jgi:long-chain acyl-CoA synthetase